eukprot:5297833-Pyramimonas_sp.AAC.1
MPSNSGGWAKESLASIQSYEWWVDMPTLHYAGDPPAHMLHWFQKRSARHREDNDRAFDLERASTLQELVDFKAELILNCVLAISRTAFVSISFCGKGGLKTAHAIPTPCGGTISSSLAAATLT